MRCIICDKEAQWFIKGTTTAYCDEHAHEFFSDTSYLASVEEEALRLRALVDSHELTVSNDSNNSSVDAMHAHSDSNSQQ